MDGSFARTVAERRRPSNKQGASVATDALLAKEQINRICIFHGSYLLGKRKRRYLREGRYEIRVERNGMVWKETAAEEHIIDYQTWRAAAFVFF